MPTIVENPTISEAMIELGYNTNASYYQNYSLFRVDHAVVKAAREDSTQDALREVIRPLSYLDYSRVFDVARVGYELEYTQGDSRSIGNALYRSGLTDSPTQYAYHSSRHLHTWRFERDASVSGEVISPPLNMLQERSHAVLSTAVKAITDHGGNANNRSAGMHTNIDVPFAADDVDAWRRLVLLWDRFEDSIYRLMANPYRTGAHRRNRFARPVRTQHLLDALASSNARLNVTGMFPSGNAIHLRSSYDIHSRSSRQVIEFRLPDASLHVGTITAQTAVLNGLLRAANTPELEPLLQRLESRPAGYQRGLRREAEEVPHAKMRGAQWRRATENIRLLVDILFQDDLPMKSAVSTLFLVNKVWPFSAA